LMWADLVRQMPFLKIKYPDHKSFRLQTIEDIFTPDQLNKSVKLISEYMLSSILLNLGNGKFELSPLPVQAQFSPMYAIQIEDFDRDGFLDIILGGNLYRAKPESGIYDGSYGVLLKGKGKGNFTFVGYANSGFFVKGEIRDIEKIRVGGNNLVAVAVNNNKLKVFKY